MIWVLVGVAVWIVLAVLGALLVGRVIHLADVASSHEPPVAVDHGPGTTPGTAPGKASDEAPDEVPPDPGRTRLPRAGS